MKKQVCVFCGSCRRIEMDHTRARVRGGVSTKPACRTCNRSKGKKTVRGWFLWLVKYNIYRWRRILSHNKYKRSVIARQVRTIRNSIKN
jgi:hypothetical protein